jgi:hypothetical protein
MSFSDKASPVVGVLRGVVIMVEGLLVRVVGGKVVGKVMALVGAMVVVVIAVVVVVVVVNVSWVACVMHSLVSDITIDEETVWGDGSGTK